MTPSLQARLGRPILGEQIRGYYGYQYISTEQISV